MSQGFSLVTKDKLKYLTIPSFEKTGLVKSCFTTRVGGVSEGYYASLNLGSHLTDDIEKVRENRRIICSALGVELSQVVAAQQTHGKSVYHVTKETMGRGAFSNEDALPNIDALMTNEPGLVLTTYYADCVPLFILDPVNKAIALAHSGWKGTVLKIGLETIKKMQETFGSNPKELLVAIAPSIGPCCYEVDERVLKEFKDNFKNYESLVEKNGANKGMLNLWEANKKVFLEAGILEGNITIAKICASCNTDLFFSHRKEEGKTGRMAAIMVLNQ